MFRNLVLTAILAAALGAVAIVNPQAARAEGGINESDGLRAAYRHPHAHKHRHWTPPQQVYEEDNYAYQPYYYEEPAYQPSYPSYSHHYGRPKHHHRHGYFQRSEHNPYWR